MICVLSLWVTVASYSNSIHLYAKIVGIIITNIWLTHPIVNPSRFGVYITKDDVAKNTKENCVFLMEKFLWNIFVHTLTLTSVLLELGTIIQYYIYEYPIYHYIDKYQMTILIIFHNTMYLYGIYTYIYLPYKKDNISSSPSYTCKLPCIDCKCMDCKWNNLMATKEETPLQFIPSIVNKGGDETIVHQETNITKTEVSSVNSKLKRRSRKCDG